MKVCPYPECRFYHEDGTELAWHLYVEHNWKFGCLCGRMKGCTAPIGVNTKDGRYSRELGKHIDSFPSLSAHLEDVKLVEAAAQNLINLARERRTNA